MKTKKIAKNLKNLRGIRGMSQEYLADESRVSLRTIQRIENNESEPTGETIKRIAIALDVELDELIGSQSIPAVNDLKTAIIFFKKKLSKANHKSEIKTFQKFIILLQKLNDKNLNSNQIKLIESYIQYLELEKIPSFKNDVFKQKFIELKKYLKSNLRLMPNNYYATWAISFGLSFSISFVVQNNIDYSIKIGVASIALLIIGIATIMDMRVKKEGRSFSF